MGVFSFSFLASRRSESYLHGSSVSLLRMTFPEILRISDLVEMIRVLPSLLVRRVIFLSRREFSGVSKYVSWIIRRGFGRSSYSEICRMPASSALTWSAPSLMTSAISDSNLPNETASLAGSASPPIGRRHRQNLGLA